MLNLKKMLTKVLSLTPMFEYVGTVNQIHWSSWTAPDDGIVIMDVGWLTNGGFGYYYVQDATEGINVGKVTTYSVNGTSNTTSFPVIKGHTYKDSAIQNVQGSSFYFRYYKIKLGGGYLTSKFYEIFSHLERWWEYVRFKGDISENIKRINWVKAVCHLLSDCEHNPDFKYRWLNTKHHASKWSSYYVFRTWLQNQYNKGCFNWSVQACYARRLCFECCKSLLLHLYNKRFNRQLLYEHRRVLVQHKCSMEREHRVQGFWSRSIQQNKYSHITIPQRGCLAC